MRQIVKCCFDAIICGALFILSACKDQELCIETNLINTRLYIEATNLSEDELPGDKLFAYNITRSKAYSLTKRDGYYSGNAYILPNDEVVCIYPDKDYQVINNRVSIEMPLLEGNMISPYYWGTSRIKQVDSITRIYVTLYPLMSTCNFSFVDESENPIDITSISLRAKKGQIYQNRELNLQTGSWENGIKAESISIDTHSIDILKNEVSISLIPTSVLFEADIVDINGYAYSASSEQYIFRENNENDVILKCEDTVVKDYVEVCGIKWAKGNLLYAADECGAEGFQSHWMLADCQWKYFDIVYGTAGTPLSVDLPYDSKHVHLFNWGTCGETVFDLTAYGTRPCTDISGKMYIDKYLKYETDDFSNAQYGDLAYWASRGKWRMPRYEEMYILYDKASYECGYVTTPDGNLVYGVLFTTPEGTRITNTSYQYFTQEQVDNGLFLPGAGYRQQAVDIIKRTGKCGFYWNSYRPETANQLNLRFINNQLFWSGDGGTYGRSIRPVLNE